MIIDYYSILLLLFFIKCVCLARIENVEQKGSKMREMVLMENDV